LDIQKLQKENKLCYDIIKALNNENVPKTIKRKSRLFKIQNDTLFYKKISPFKGQTLLLVIPVSLINNILKSYHDSPIGGHSGIWRTIHKIQNKYYWQNLNKDTTNFVKSCPECQINKKIGGKPIGSLQPIPISHKPLNKLTFDYLGPLPHSNNKKYILVAICNTTKYIFTKAVSSATAESTVQFIIEIIKQWGCLQNFTSDRGTHFRNHLVTDTYTSLRIKQITPTSYSP